MAEGFYDFTPGQVLTAAQVDDYLMRQAVMRFADSAARTTALSGVLVEGMMSYLKDTNTVEVYDGSAWVSVGGVGNANFTNTETGSYTSGGKSYKYLTLNASGTITIDQDGLADLLIIAGGGGGGTGDPDRAGGGGGAGGYLAITGAYLPAGTLTVVVGGGGAGATSINTTGSWGTTSKIASYYAPHGAGGSGVGDGFPGGSGSGAYASPSAFTGGTAIADLGNDGGDSFASGTSALRSGGGGGGAGGVGGDGASGVGGAGGSGTSSSITNSATSRAGGGGGGSGTIGGSATDGGGAGGGGAAGSSGTANTGGGGGGAGGSSGNGGNGGSGVVIVRVEV